MYIVSTPFSCLEIDMTKKFGALLVAALMTISANAAVTVTTSATAGSSAVLAASGTTPSGGVLLNFDTYGTTGTVSGFTLTNSGASWVNGALNAPLFSGITNPTADMGNFISVSSGGYQQILNATTAYNTLSIYWGSPDATNTLDLLDASGNSIYQLTSAGVSGLSAMTSGLVTLTSSQAFNGIKIGSSAGVNFEFDNVGFSTTAQSAVPEAGTWAMMILGFGAIGYALRSRKVGFGASNIAA